MPLEKQAPFKTFINACISRILQIPNNQRPSSSKSSTPGEIHLPPRSTRTHCTQLNNFSIHLAYQHRQSLMGLLAIHSFQKIRLPRMTIPLCDRLPHIPFEGRVEWHVQRSISSRMDHVPIHESQREPGRIHRLISFLTAPHKKYPSLLHTHG